MDKTALGLRALHFEDLWAGDWQTDRAQRAADSQRLPRVALPQLFSPLLAHHTNACYLPGWGYSREHNSVGQAAGLPLRSLSSGRGAVRSGSGICDVASRMLLLASLHTAFRYHTISGWCLIQAPHIHSVTRASASFSLAVACPQTSTSWWGQEQIGLHNPGQGDQGWTEVWFHLWLSNSKNANFSFILNVKWRRESQPKL